MSSALVVVSLILQVLTLFVLAFFLFQLFKSQGRLLLRLDSLERSAAGLVNIETANAGPQGLEAGTTIEDFQLPDLSGNTVSLSGFRGKKVLLMYWSPSCGFCDATAQKLGPMWQELANSNIQPVLVAYGDAEANRRLAEEHKLKWPILLMKDTPSENVLTQTVFQHCGTPSAYLLGGEGKVEGGLVVGADAIARCAREAMQAAVKDSGMSALLNKKPLSQSRIERRGIKAGTPAPAFVLPDIHGELVALNQFRGRKVLLVFSDPHCGPCNDLTPELVRLHRKYQSNGMAFVMVGRGDPEDNKKKAQEHQIEFPVVIQEKWKLSREYGIFATPVAFLIGKDGIVVKDVATGTDQVLTLAHEGLASH